MRELAASFADAEIVFAVNVRLSICAAYKQNQMYIKPNSQAEFRRLRKRMGWNKGATLYINNIPIKSWEDFKKYRKAAKSS